MINPNGFDFEEFGNSGGFNSFWQRQSVKNDEDSFFSDEFKDKNKQDINQKQLIQQSNHPKIQNRLKQQKQDQKQQAVNVSRSLQQIDMSDFKKVNEGYYYQKQVLQNPYDKDQNYQILKKCLSIPKKMDFNKFFSNLEKNQDISNDSFMNRQQYKNAEEYQKYKQQIKQQKRQQQQKRQNQPKDQQNNLMTISKQIQVQENLFIKKIDFIGILDEDLIQFNRDQGLQTKQYQDSSLIQFKSKLTKDKFNSKKSQQNKKDTQSLVFKKTKQSSIPKSQLPTIVDADENIFQTTLDQMKLNNLFGNFKNLMQNYNLLRDELKLNKQGHNRMMTQLNAFNNGSYQQKKAQQYNNKQIKQKILPQKSLRQLMILSREEAKDKINQIQLDIYKKIQNLENVVKETFDKDNNQNNNLVWINPDFKCSSERSIKSSSIAGHKQLSVKQNNKSFSDNINVQQVLSPLNYRLNDYQIVNGLKNNTFNARSKQIYFQTQHKKIYQGICHQPKLMLIDNFLKNTYIQDNTIIFQSFDFIVSAKYSLVRTGRIHSKIAITVKNKTFLSLYDFMIIIYGSLGQVLQLSPSKLYLQKLGSQQSQILQAVTDSFKIGLAPIMMQISYRTERNRKGKVNVKIPRPITKFLDIKFTHEYQFNQLFASSEHQIYLLPRMMNFSSIKSIDDIKLIFPFIEIDEINDKQFSYGLVFSILNIEGLFIMKLLCNVQGSAEVYLKFEDQNLRQYGKQILDAMNIIMFT